MLELMEHRKVNLDLDEERAAYLDQIVTVTGLSEVEVLREAFDRMVQQDVKGHQYMRGVFHDPTLVGKHDDLLEGLGE